MILPFWLQVIFAVFATCQLAEIVRHGSIFAPLRARIEARGPFWADLIGCGFCFSHWASGFVTLVLLVGHYIMESGGYPMNPFIIILIWLAVTRGSNLLNDLTKQWSRTPSGSEIEILPLGDEDRMYDGKATTRTGYDASAGSEAQ